MKKSNHLSKETKRKISDKKKGEKHHQWEKPLSEEHKRKISEKMKGVNNHFYGKRHSEETIRKLSAIKKGKLVSEETRQKMSEAKKGEKNNSWKGGEVKINCKVCGKERHVKKSQIKRGHGRLCSYRCSGIWQMLHQRNQNTEIERLIEDELIKRGIPYTKQVALLGITIVDFLLAKDTVIYADGTYWHSSEKRKVRDTNQNFMLTFHGYKVFRFTENEIKKSAKECIDKVLKFIRGKSSKDY